MTSLGAVFLSVLVLQVLTPHTANAFSDFQILAPEVLARDPRYTTPRLMDRNATGIQHLPAMFGNPPFGKTIYANLFYPSMPSNQLGCQPFDLTNETNWPTSSEGRENSYVLLLKRTPTQCSFKQKVRNAQTVGAAVVMVYADQPGQSLLYMADDNSGDSVFIPSVFILHQDAQSFIAQLRNNVPVTLAMTWSFVAPDDKVEWDLWTSARDPQTFKFKQVFGAVEVALGSRTEFTPHYLFLRYSFNPDNNCMNRGRYCVPDPNANTPGLLGRDVVRENLRQLCLFRELKDRGSPDTWWQYVSKFETECSLAAQWRTPECGENIITRLNQNLTAVNLCIAQAPLSPDSDTTHPVIEAELQAYATAGMPFLPTVIINEEHYRGNIECATPIDVTTCPILQALCSGFLDGTQPDVCISNGCGFGIKRDCRGICGGNSVCDATESSPSSGVSIGAVIGIVIGGMILIGIGIVIYMKRQKQQITDGMDHMLRQYLPMEDSESINHTNDRRSALTQHP